MPIAQAQVVLGTDGGLALKVQQTKLPEFWGQKDKDIAANEFVKRVDNNWTDYFGLALRGSAKTWLDSQIMLKNIVGDQEHLMIICPFFKEEFEIKSDDKLILDGLEHIAMWPFNIVPEFFGYLNKINRIIMDAYKSNTLMPAEPVSDINVNVI